MDLFFRELGEGKPLIILHGLLGSSDNWLTVSKAFTNNRVILIDQRNHGNSFHDNNFSIDVMVNDLKEFITANKLQSPTIMGHSMGGKVAMGFALKNPELLDKLIVVDIAPKYYTRHHDHIFDGLFSIDLQNTKTRQEADLQLSQFVKDEGERQFLLKNLSREKDGTFKWKPHLNVIRENIETIGQGFSENVSFEKPTLFIKGSNSRYIKPEDHPLIQTLFPSSKIVTIENAGHWVHAEQPVEFSQIINDFLNQ